MLPFPSKATRNTPRDDDSHIFIVTSVTCKLVKYSLKYIQLITQKPSNYGSSSCRLHGKQITQLEHWFILPN